MQGDVERVGRGLAGLYQRDGDNKRLRPKFQPFLLGGTHRIKLEEIQKTGKSSVKVVSWARGRMAIRVIFDHRNKGGSEKVLLIEGGQLVESPMPGSEDYTPPEAALWKRVPAKGGTS